MTSLEIIYEDKLLSHGLMADSTAGKDEPALAWRKVIIQELRNAVLNL